MFDGQGVKIFDGASVHVLQIGLGTCGTFLHADSWWLQVLLEASTQGVEEELRGIGVDPVEECVEKAKCLAEGMGGVSLVVAAVSEVSGSGSLFCLPRGSRVSLLKELEHKGVDLWKPDNVDMYLIHNS